MEKHKEIKEIKTPVVVKQTDHKGRLISISRRDLSDLGQRPSDDRFTILTSENPK